jgi:hypothetical protein
MDYRIGGRAGGGRSCRPGSGRDFRRRTAARTPPRKRRSARRRRRRPPPISTPTSRRPESGTGPSPPWLALGGAAKLSSTPTRRLSVSELSTPTRLLLLHCHLRGGCSSGCSWVGPALYWSDLPTGGGSVGDREAAPMHPGPLFLRYAAPRRAAHDEVDCLVSAAWGPRALRASTGHGTKQRRVLCIRLTKEGRVAVGDEREQATAQLCWRRVVLFPLRLAQPSKGHECGVPVFRGKTTLDYETFLRRGGVFASGSWSRRAI